MDLTQLIIKNRCNFSKILSALEQFYSEFHIGLKRSKTFKIHQEVNMHNIITRISALSLTLLLLFWNSTLNAEPLKVGQAAPTFELNSQDGKTFNLASRKGQGWTVLYFYPKAGTPGCTTQACAFRDAIEGIRKLNTEVYGISTDEIADLQSFHQKHKLRFDLLSDPDAKVTEAYDVKMPVIKLAKRWTFIVDPDLMIRSIDDDVDPVIDAQKVTATLKQLQGIQ